MVDIRAPLIASVLFATNALVQAQDLDNGRTEFLSKCAECHGADGKGAGPMTGKLKRKPADLTALARNNDGFFSAAAVAAIVDGRGAVQHRRLEMPIWGCRHGPPSGRQSKGYQPKPIDSLLDMPCDPEEVTRKRILEIVDYLRRIQEK
jgi:mono/diheme cytochrome c family protein